MQDRCRCRSCPEQPQQQPQQCSQQQASPVPKSKGCLLGSNMKYYPSCIDTIPIKTTQKNGKIPESLQKERKSLITFLKNHENFREKEKNQKCFNNLECHQNNSLSLPSKKPVLIFENDKELFEKMKQCYILLKMQKQSNDVASYPSHFMPSCLTNIPCVQGPKRKDQQKSVRKNDSEAEDNFQDISPKSSYLSIFKKNPESSPILKKKSENVIIKKEKQETRKVQKKRPEIQIVKKKRRDCLLVEKKRCEELEITGGFVNVIDLFSKVWQCLCAMIYVLFGGQCQVDKKDEVETDYDDYDDEEDYEGDDDEKDKINIERKKNENRINVSKKNVEKKVTRSTKKNKEHLIADSGMKILLDDIRSKVEEEEERRRIIDKCLEKYLKKTSVLKEEEGERLEKDSHDVEKTNQQIDKKQEKRKSQMCTEKNRKEDGKENGKEKEGRDKKEEKENKVDEEVKEEEIEKEEEGKLMASIQKYLKKDSIKTPWKGEEDSRDIEKTNQPIDEKQEKKKSQMTLENNKKEDENRDGKEKEESDKEEEVEKEEGQEEEKLRKSIQKYLEKYSIKGKEESKRYSNSTKQSEKKNSSKKNSERESKQLTNSTSSNLLKKRTKSNVTLVSENENTDSPVAENKAEKKQIFSGLDY